MKFRLGLNLLLLISSNFLPCSANVQKPYKEQDFIIGTHYYGFHEFNWPINYLHSIKDSDVKTDLKTIKDMGFNSIILLAAWPEFEPEIGSPDEYIYKKINNIIKTAKKLNIDVFIRIPYLWSIEGDEIRQRLAYALLDYGDYRKNFLKFMADFRSRVVVPNSNVIELFGSWEDFYVVRDLFFSRKDCLSKFYNVCNEIGKAFKASKGIEKSEVALRGKNFDKFMSWIDEEILKLSQEIGNYGYEARVDLDPYEKDGKIYWHSHKSFIDNKTNGSVIGYWTPHYGQKNNGEYVNGEQAVNSMGLLLDSIWETSSKKPFIDQLNFTDNTVGFSKNAKIYDDKYPEFFEKLVPVITSRTKGYAFWTIKDYDHSIIYNPRFQVGLKGWESKNVKLDKSGVIIKKNGYLSQNLRERRYWQLETNEPTVIVNLISGKANIEVGSSISNVYEEPGRHEIKYRLKDSDKKGFSLKIKNQSDQDLHINSINIIGHKHLGYIFDRSGMPSRFKNLISTFNHAAAKSSLDDSGCKGFVDSFSKKNSYKTRGVYDDRWTETKFEICKNNLDKNKTGFSLKLLNPSLNSRFLRIESDGDKKIPLKKGINNVNICPSYNKKTILLSTSSKFVPSLEIPGSPDVREFGVNIQNISDFDCTKN